MSLTRSQQFIKDNAYRLSSAADYFNVDSALMRKESYEGSKLKMLLILPTPALQKSVSATVSVINSSFADTHEGCFLDIAYLPPKEDQKYFDDAGIPYCIGHITHLDASHFDVIGFSISVLHEIITIPVIINSFSRCDKPIPLTWTERKACKIGDQPFVIAGGITAVNSDICFGDLKDGTGRVGYLDGLILGQDDVLEDIFPLIFEAQAKNAASLAEGGPGLTIEESIEMWYSSLHFYHPYAYDIQYRDNLIVKNVKINQKARDLVKPRYDKTIKKRLYSARTVVSATGANAGSTQIMLSEGCTGGNGNCRFCAEGHYTGSWVENPIENVKWAAREAKRYCAASSVKPMSFNCNHYSDYSELLYELKKEYPVVTFINMRLEELAQDTESWDMMSYLGASRLSAPVEGLSDRVRNNLMNKNLSLESVETLFDYMIGQGISDLKVGLVWTGFEEESDWDEITEQMIRLKKKADILGKKLPIRFKATPLVMYPLTAFEYIERKSTRLSYHGKRFISDERYAKNRAAGIQIRFNGFPHSTFMEQTLVDLGSSITWWVHKNLVQSMEIAYDLRVLASSEERINSFKALITNHDNFFGEKDMDNYISPTHRIRLDVEGGTFVSARAILKGKDPEPTGKCLYTYGGCSTSCSFKDIRDNPYVRFTDCEIGANGKIFGRIFNKIEGCQYCETPKERVDHHLKRKLSKKYTMKDITSEVYARNLSKYRIVIERQFDYKEVNPHNTAYTTLAKLNDVSEVFLDNYWEIDKHSFDHQMEPDIPCAIYGIQVIDVLFKSSIDHAIPDAIKEANKWLKASRIISITPIQLDEKIKLTHLNVFRFETNMPIEKILSANKKYNKEVKVKKDMEVVIVQDKQLITPAVASYGKTIGYFTLPVRYNPYLYLQTLLKDSRTSYNSLKAEFVIKSVMFTSESKSAVCSCGKPTLISLVNNKALKCPTCLTKSALIVEMNKHKEKQTA